MNIDDRMTKKYEGAELAARLKGYTYADAIQDTDKSKYSTEHDYLNAVTENYLKHADPSYSSAYKGVQAELAAQREAEQKKNRAQRVEELNRTITLDFMDQRDIDRKARQLAEEELNCGQITYSGIAARIKYHGDRLAEQRRSEKVNNQLCNEIIRGKI